MCRFGSSGGDAFVVSKTNAPIDKPEINLTLSGLAGERRSKP
jgi:hypothetical protein